MKKDKNTTKITPLGDRILIRPFKEREEYTMGKIKIMLPESVTSEKSDRGKVVAVGEGRYIDGKLIAPRVKAGDTVIFSKYGYDEVKLEDEELYIVKEDNILAIIK